MKSNTKPAPNQYLDRNGNIRTIAIRHQLAHRRMLEKLAARRSGAAC